MPNLTCPALLGHFGDYAAKGQTDSEAFLAWFLENYYRLDDTEIDDSICDEENDKGIDGIYVNDLLQQIDVFQTTIGYADPPQYVGDVRPKEFLGALTQLRTGDSVRQLTAATQSTKLKQLLERLEVAQRIDDGYEVRGVFVTNRFRNQDTIDLLAISSNLVLYDNVELDRQYLPIDRADPIATPISFDVSTVGVLEHTIEDDLTMAIAPLAASELITMEGIANQELFAWNLRYRLRRSPVNKAIELSIGTAAEHKYFPAFHNGLTVLCENLEVNAGKLTVSGYAVVNGCQSLNALYHNQVKITPDLRILSKFIKVPPTSELAQKITDHTNNQNGITGRDQKSKDQTQGKLQTEIHRQYAGEVFYRISRGEHLEWPADKVIENDAAARILLAFDLKNPDSAHQRYKLFGDLYSDIFKRPEVNADRVIALFDLDQIIRAKRGVMSHKAFAHYSLTPFLFLYLLREALETDETGMAFCQNPSEFLKAKDGRLRLRHSIEPTVTALMRIMDAYLKRQEDNETGFDYKKDLKSPRKILDIRTFVIPFYQITLDTGGDLKSFSELWQESERAFATLEATEGGTSEPR
jgi:hypothetical protein